MNQDSLIPIKAAIAAAIMSVVGLYAGAFIIALLAAFVRMAYRAEDSCSSHFNCFSDLMRYFIMNLGITMLIVHIGIYMQYSRDLIIIISSIAAFLSREALDTVVYTAMATKRSLSKIIIDKLRR